MRKARKVLLLVENSYVPVDPRVWAEAKTLRDAGYQVSIICPKGPTRHRESYIYLEHIHVYRYDLPRHVNRVTDYPKEFVLALAWTFLLSLKVLVSHGFDVIHAANPPDFFFLLGVFYRLLGKKFIFDLHDPAPEMFAVKFQQRLRSKLRMKLFIGLLIFFEWCSYKTAHLVITSNGSQKMFALQRGHCQSERVVVVRNGPDLQQLQAVPAEPELKEGKQYLLAYLGLISSQDGVPYALDALQELIYRRGRRDVALVVMGDGDYAPVVHRLASELGLDAYVNFTGWIERKDIQRYLSVADIGICPEPKDGLNEYCTMIKTMEYMAMSLPIVAFDLAETRFSAQDAGLYAAPNDVVQLADTIETLLDDEELRHSMGAAGRKRIEEVLSWNHSQQQLLLAYDRLLGQSSSQNVGTGFSPSVGQVGTHFSPSASLDADSCPSKDEADGLKPVPTFSGKTKGR